MAINEMDARLISQGTQVESVGAEALIPVASGEGQPQSNITLANLADSLGKAVPQQQDAEQVTMTGLYAQTSDGKMVELTKESVASVMAGLMGTNKLFPFMNMGSVSDIDSISKSGTYGFNLSTDNEYVPTLGYQWGQVVHFEGPQNWGTFQILTNNKSGDEKMFYRRRTGKTWSNLFRFDNFGATTKEELASMVAGLMPFNSRLGTYSGDLDTLHQTAGTGVSCWTILSSATNTIFQSNGGLLLNVSRYNVVNALSVVMQFAIEASDNTFENLKFRAIFRKGTSNSDVIGKWETISFVS